MFESVQPLLDEHAQLQEELADPALHADAARAKKVNRRYAELSRIVAANAAWQDRFPGLFDIRNGVMRTGQLTGPGLGAVAQRRP